MCHLGIKRRQTLSMLSELNIRIKIRLIMARVHGPLSVYYDWLRRKNGFLVKFLQAMRLFRSCQTNFIGHIFQPSHPSGTIHAGSCADNRLYAFSPNESITVYSKNTRFLRNENSFIPTNKRKEEKKSKAKNITPFIHI